MSKSQKSFSVIISYCKHDMLSCDVNIFLLWGGGDHSKKKTETLLHCLIKYLGYSLISVAIDLTSKIL